MKKIIFIFGLFSLGIIFSLTLDSKQSPAPNEVFAYLNTQKPYLEGYQKAGKVNFVSNVKGIIINHHFFGSEYMAQIIQKIKSQESKTVVIISPNHFFSGNGNIQVGNIKFKTPFGDLLPDTKTAINFDDFSNSDFSKEHGVTALVGFIKKEIPNAKVIPIIIKDHITKNEIDKFSTELYKKLPRNSVIIASLDFSHYVPLNYAQFQDEMALSSLKNLDQNRTAKLNIDSVPSLQVMLNLMSKYGYEKFNLVNTGSSSILQKNFETLENTSYITGYFTKGSNKRINQTNLFIGSKIYSDYPEPFRFIAGADFVYLNYSEKDYLNIPLKFKKYGVNRLRQVDSASFNLNNGCNPNKLSIIVEYKSKNSIELDSRCLIISLQKGNEFDVGISIYKDSVKIYYLPVNFTDKIESNLDFVQGIATFKL